MIMVNSQKREIASKNNVCVHACMSVLFRGLDAHGRFLYAVT